MAGEKDEELEIITDDTEQDQDTPEGESSDEDDEDEVRNYSASVQKRINNLTAKMRAEQRAREQAERERSEFSSRAAQLEEEAKTLRSQLQDGHGALADQAVARIDAQIEQTLREAKEAYDGGDTDKFVASQSKLITLNVERSRVAGFKRSIKTEQPQPTSQPKPQPQAPQARAPSSRALAWKDKNGWFENDSEMTGYVYGVHASLIQGGVEPDSEQYYRQIDQKMRERFPDRLGESEKRQARGSVVAAPTRTPGGKPRTVRLTPTQVAIAKRLGITETQYAQQLLKDQGNG